MKKIITEFNDFFENNKIKGLHNWFYGYENYYVRNEVIEYINENLLFTKKVKEKFPLMQRAEENLAVAKRITEELTNFTLIQQNIIILLVEDQVSILDLKGSQLNLEALDEESIAEVILFYDLKQPAKRYKAIKTAISAPSNFMTRIPYSVINNLYQRGKVPFDRTIFAACLIRYNVHHGAHYSDVLTKEETKKLFDCFPKDAFTLDILMTIFETEIGVTSAFYLERRFDIRVVIQTFIEAGKLDKIEIQHKIFEAFNNPLLKNNTQTWMKLVYIDLYLSIDEELATQDKMLSLLYNDVNLLVNFSIQKLKKMSVHKSFNWPLLIQSLNGIVYREKLNAGLKTIMTILLKKVKKEPELLEEICINLAPIFLQTDAKVQIVAQNIFELLPLPNAKVKETLSPFVDTMHSDIKVNLFELLGQEQDKIPLAEYQQKQYRVQPLSSLQELTYIQTTEDFVFQVSKALKSHDFLDYELFLEGLTHFYEIKNTHSKVLKPALKQAEQLLKRKEINKRIGIHHMMVAFLVQSWLKDETPSIADEIAFWQKELQSEKKNNWLPYYWLSKFKQFSTIASIDFSIRNNKKPLPFLSIPTHKNGQIHPQIFLERLAIYEQNNETPNPGDFDLALCRINRWTAFKNEKTNTEYDKIFQYLMDDNIHFSPKNIKKLETSWLVAFTLKSPTKNIQAVLNHRKNVAKWWESSEWNWELFYREKKWLKINVQVNEQDPYATRFQTANFNHFGSYLDIQSDLLADSSHWFSRNPFYVEIIYIKSIINDYRWMNYLESAEKRAILETIIKSAENLQTIGKAGYLYLVLSLFSQDKSIRIASLDWLLLLIDNSYLDITEFTTTFSKLFANPYEHFMPVSRVAEQFEQLLQLKGVYLDVLEKTIENVIPKMNSTNLPKGFSKILHYYFEVLRVTSKSIPKEVAVSLERLKSVKLLKKQIEKLEGIK